MAIVVWDSIYEFKIPIMDEQHKSINSIMNSIIEDLESGKIDENLKKQCQEALISVANHFVDEEKLMEDIGYPQINRHKEKHKEIMDRLVDVKKEIDIGEDIISESIAEELREMFKKHMLIEDKRYAFFYHKGTMLSEDLE